jgi:hypothetical protein
MYAETKEMKKFELNIAKISLIKAFHLNLQHEDSTYFCGNYIQK